MTIFATRYTLLVLYIIKKIIKKKLMYSNLDPNNYVEKYIQVHKYFLYMHNCANIYTEMKHPQTLSITFPMPLISRWKLWVMKIGLCMFPCLFDYPKNIDVLLQYLLLTSASITTSRHFYSYFLPFFVILFLRIVQLN